MEGKARPADLLITPWKEGKSIAVDLTLVHPLIASSLWSTDNNAVAKAEQDKVLKYSDLCDRAHLLFNPAGLDTIGGPGPMALGFLKTLFNTYAQHQSTEESQQARSVLIAGCWERLTMAVAKAVAFQLSRLAYPMPSASHEHVSPRVGTLQERQQSTTTADISQSHTQATATSAANGSEQTERGVPPRAHADSTRASPRQSPATPSTGASQSQAQAAATTLQASDRLVQAAVTPVRLSERQAHVAATSVRPSKRQAQAAATSVHNRGRGKTK